MTPKMQFFSDANPNKCLKIVVQEINIAPIYLFSAILSITCLQCKRLRLHRGFFLKVKLEHFWFIRKRFDTKSVDTSRTNVPTREKCSLSSKCSLDIGPEMQPDEEMHGIHTSMQPVHNSGGLKNSERTANAAWTVNAA